jgi:hypothetical protein
MTKKKKFCQNGSQVDGMKLANLVRYIFQTFFLIGSDLVKYLSLSTHIIFFNVFRGGLVTSSQTVGSLLIVPGWRGQ